LQLRGYQFSPGLVPSLVALALLALLLALGTWQLGRAEEKRELESLFAARLDEAPVALDPGALAIGGPSPEAWLYRRVSLAGTWLAERQFLLDNRTHHGVAGYHVLSPLQIEEDEPAVLVNRGWVPVGPDRRRLPDLPLPDHRVEVEGLLEGPREESLLLGPAGYEDSGWPRRVQRVELAPMEAHLGRSLLPVVVLLADREPDGFVRDWQPYLGISPARHGAYAFQWYSLAAALVGIYLVVNTRRLPAGEGGSS
jgi:surfeit locus 1 family protein